MPTQPEGLDLKALLMYEAQLDDASRTSPTPTSAEAARPGDIFREKDVRMKGRHVKVLSVEGRYARCSNCTPEGSELPSRHTRVSLRGLETRFEKVGGSRLRADLERAAIKALIEWRKADRDFPTTLDFAKHNYAAGEYQQKLAALRAAADKVGGEG